MKFAFRRFVVGAGTLALFGGMASTALAAQHGPTLSPARGLGFAPHAHAGSGVQKAARSGLSVSDALKRRLVAKQQRPPFKSLWSRQLGGVLEFPPAIGGRASFIETGDGRVVALSARNGHSLWTQQLAAPLASKPALDAHSLYVSSLGGFVYALRQSDGAVRWRFAVGARSESSPLLRDGVLYFGAQDGSLFALDAKTGHVRWHQHVDGAIKGAPTVAAGRLVVGAYDGHVYAFNPSSGRVIWRTDGPALGQFYSSPVDRRRARLHRLHRRQYLRLRALRRTPPVGS